MTNVDRTARNTNMLIWHRRLWLIDHGAALYFHHTPGWESAPTRARDPFALIKDHVLLPFAPQLATSTRRWPAALTPDVARHDRRARFPDGWLERAQPRRRAGELRAAYAALPDATGSQAPRAFVEEAVRAR